ncbi:Ferric reductase transmembrane component 5 [Hypsizygus marmoreus]|uniref:ferric-chelate reductase (NADPH) n=1 Tax=Hypsizygus marmoreus TaxID=39966 RepID=A0A369K027_HYPMA|nr:Ferric reductase transmembrane component 5 [Hypsizygus marmoreus]
MSVSGEIDPQVLVFHVTLFVLAIVGLLILFRFPRAFARFWRASEWSNGHLFWRTSNQNATTITRSGTTKSSSSNVDRSFPGYARETKENFTDDSHTLYLHQKKRAFDGRAPQDVSYPPHIATCPRFLRPLARIQRLRISPGFSLAQGVIMTLYFCTMIYAGFYKSSPFTDPVRTGWVAVAQLPFVFALASKNNILSMLLGFTYEKLNYLHRFIGRLVVIAVNVHSLGYFYKWTLSGKFTKMIKLPFATWGLVALVALDVMVIFSTSFVRRKAYNLFIATHVAGMIVTMVGIWLHKPAMIPWLAACIGLYGLDYIHRMIKTRISTATIRPLPELETTRIELPNINGGWRAGQHVRLRVLSFGLGWLGWTEVHPFTIASTSGGQEGLVLMARKDGGFTSRLYEMAKAGGYTEAGFGRNIKVVVEGPYGGPGHAIFASYSAAVFIVGGSGITFALSVVQDLIKKDLKGRSRVKVIELIWVVPDAECANPLLPLFVSMIQESIYTPVHISIHYTRAPLSGKTPTAPPQPGLTLSPGRPRVTKVIEAAISRTVCLGGGPKDSQPITGMLVGVCGPVTLGDDVSNAVGAVDPMRRDQVGGIEIHEEVFGW